MLFAQDLQDALKELGKETTSTSWKDAMADKKEAAAVVTPGKAIHVFLASVTGVGEPPDNGRDFYEWLMKQEKSNSNSIQWKDVEYTVFGLGNNLAHPKYYNVIAKAVDQKLEELGARRIMKIGLGDDGDCIEDDFDKYLEQLLDLLKNTTTTASSSVVVEESPAEAEVDLVDGVSSSTAYTLNEMPRISCPPGISLRDDGTRLVSQKHSPIKLLPRVTDFVRDNLFHLQGTPDQFYLDSVQEWQVKSNQSLSPQGGETALHEMKIHIASGEKIKYETGDHLIIYPRNSQVIVEAYLNRLDVDRHAIIADEGQTAGNYPHPKGLTVYETLSHCVDLGATPPPAFARSILGTKDFDYKNVIAHSRRTVIDLLGEQGPDAMISLEDLLYGLPPMKPRYYSIASSNLMRPNEVVLVFRPCKYMTNRGILREGLCTTYMMHQAAAAVGSAVDTTTTTSVPASINSNPTFRLPSNPEIPVLFIAGGCGVAPIRAFVEERMALGVSNYGPCTLFLGFRSPKDEVYQPLFDRAVAMGALSDAKIAFSQCAPDSGKESMNVSTLVRLNGDKIWDHFENGGYTFICGGARTLGAAVEKEMLDVLQEHGNMTFEEAESYLRNLAEKGRLLEDLAD
jgi:NADPH-ferrihemoprotein reductase